MNTNLNADHSSLYETDYLKWIEANLEKLRFQEYDKVDWENLIEEIEDLGRTERRSLEDNLVALFLHLLKWQYQPEKRTGSWKGSISEHRRRIRKALKESPGLKPYFEEILAECYSDAVQQASDETGLAIETFPDHCLYTTTEVLETNLR